MKTYICLAVLAWNIFVCSCHSQQDNEDRRIYIKLKEILNRLQQEDLKHDKVKKENIGKEHIKKENIGKEHIKAIERQNVDPDSQYMQLFESFQVLQNKKKFKPKDIHPENSKHVKAEREDSHILTHGQKVELGLESEKPGEDNDKGGMESRAFGTNSKLWEKKIVPYKIDQSLNNPEAIGVINQAISVFDNVTCVQWRPYSTSLATEVGHDAYINFYSGSGCWSYVGRIVNSGQQYISLRNPGCVGVGTAIHEMLHALGQWHEQSRADRDKHVSVTWDILGKQPTNGDYGKFRTMNFNPYDYESILHYSWTNGFKPLQKELGFLTSYGSYMSYYDIADVIDAYRCTEQCVDPPDCKNGGFVNFKCKCSCPYGLTGRTCDSVINSEVCGGIIDLIPGGQDKTITSPNYPNDYDVDTQCVWLLRAPESFHVRVDTDVFHLPYDHDNNRCFHWMEVRYNLVGQTGIRKCGDTTGETWVTSQWGEKNLMLLIFDSVFGKDHFPEKGFSFRARTVKDGCMPDPCIYGVCVDCDDQSYKCECDPGFEGQNCEIVDASNTLECSFENGRKCFMKNAANDQFDLRLNFGPTVSDLTGPDGAVDGNNYLYAEASYPRQLGDTAVLESDLTFSAEDRCLTFYYNMFGAGIGSLTVNSTSTILWSKFGNQGLKWNLAKVDIPQTSNLKIIIEVKRGSDWEGDIAIDDIKLAPGLCVNPVQSECLVKSKGQDYTGTKAVTKDGVTCQRWDSNTPHSHNSHVFDEYENYCRNTLGVDAAPWCYTTDLNDRWGYCDIPHCHIEECIRSINGYDYMGTKSTTTQGKTCISGEVCRASGNDPAPWCKTTDQNTYWDSCTISKCTTEPKECLQTGRGVDYFGTESVTESGVNCQRWDKQTPHQHNYWNLEDQENFCRNPDNSNRPWCFSMNETVAREYCRIPYCEDLPCESDPCLHGATCNNTDNSGFVCHCRVGYEGATCDTRTKQEDCKRTADGYDYQGQMNVTTGNLTCQRWELDYPQPHEQNGLPENYCRNPDHESAPWCYTMDSKRYELCDVPFCTTPPKECLESEKGAEYFGTVHKTHNGKTCQKWSEQSPHSHSLAYLGDQENFCRNPFGSDDRPWCYTTDPGDRWRYCAIPSC